MKKIMISCIMVLALVACEKNNDTIVCGDYKVSMTFSEDGDTMNAVINGDELELTRAISASGARYVGVLNDTTVELWGKGNEWYMYLDDGQPIFCK